LSILEQVVVARVSLLMIAETRALKMEIIFEFKEAKVRRGLLNNEYNYRNERKLTNDFSFL